MRSVIEISKRNLLKNFSSLKNNCKNLYLVVKANAYGHGISEVVDGLKNCDFNGFALANNEELFEISNLNRIKKNFLIMSPVLDEYFSEIVFRFENVEFFVYSLDFLKEVDSWTKKNKKFLKIHLKIETGMNRLGIDFNEIDETIKILENNFYLKLIGLATHYGDTYRFENFNILKQQEKFTLFYKKFLLQKFESLKIFNGVPSGAIDLNEYNTCRVGSYLYGFWKSEEQKKRFLEKNENFSINEIMKWKTKILQIKFVEEGEIIGYGITTIAEKKKKIAIISVGYSDGFNLIFSKNQNGFVLINGKSAKILGVISMNMATIDVTEIENIDLKSDVYLINNDHKDFTISELSKKIEISSLQFSTLISRGIKRVLIDA